MASPHTPLDWNPAAPAAVPHRPPGPVDVIVPVYGAAAELEACLESLLRHTALSHHRLVLVIDGPQEPDVEAALGVLAGLPENVVTILRNPTRRGFVGSVNRGMGLSDRDAVLLNSDTEVTARWLEKLQEAAYSDPAIATVTPFSNNATIASLPRFAEVNALPAGWSADRFAALVERAAARERPRLPTGVGVCLYIKRKALDRLGPFDEERFGLGYGEESEFCFRALKAGFLNVLDDATFIYHAGQRSFGSSRSARVKAAHRAMRRLHPEYIATVASFLRADPLKPARERVLAGLRCGQRSVRAGGPRRVLHLVHGWPPWNPAGTEVYARRLALRQAAWREVTVYARMADPGRELGEALEVEDGGVRVRLVVNNFTQRDPLSRNALHDRRLAADFRRLLEEERPDLLHVHHLAGHAANLPGVAARRGIPILYQVQDWWSPCARANLLDDELAALLRPGAGQVLGLPAADRAPPGAAAQPGALRRPRPADPAGPAPGGRPRDGLPGDPPELSGARLAASGGSRLRDPLRHRAAAGPVWRAASAAPSRRAAPLRHHRLDPPPQGDPRGVRGLPGRRSGRAPRSRSGGTRRPPRLYTAALAALASPAVRLAGRFDEERRSEIFAGLDVLIVPSLGLESFGLVAREALAEGVPVLAARRGALAELFEGEAEPCGALFDPEDPEELRAWIERLVQRPEIARRLGREPAAGQGDGRARRGDRADLRTDSGDAARHRIVE